MGRYTGKQCRLFTMIGLTVSFFLVEIIVGHITNSVALVADSFHMLSDVIALCVGLASVKISKKGSKSNTFGWIRAEVLGALVNAVFLVALCFSIFVRGIQRLIEPEKIDDPVLLLVVGGIGLFINLIGLVLFHGHGHSHGGHSHEKEPLNTELTPTSVKVTVEPGKEGAESVYDENQSTISSTSQKKIVSSAQLNMRGVFLHVLGDALGSVIVIISALIIWLVDPDTTKDDHWKYKLDPAMSLMMVVIILCTTIPLVKESGQILLLRVPDHIRVQELKKKLVLLSGVTAVHEFHVWQLAGSKIIATAHIHIKCHNLDEYNRISEDVKVFFHKEEIHSTTIQLELTLIEDETDITCPLPCALECGPDKDCYQKTCCAPKDKKSMESPKKVDGRRNHSNSPPPDENLDTVL